MPIKDKTLYPANWPEIRKRILERDGYKCKFCGVDNYALVLWDKDRKKYERAGGSIYIDELGNGERPYKEARDAATFWNEAHDDKGNWIVIVLTIMHLDHNPQNNDDKNLAAGCQRCHNRYDRNFRNKNAAETRRQKKKLQTLF